MEKIILYIIIIVFLAIFVESIFFYFNLKNVINREKLYKILIYCSIALTGSVNFLLYDFYSCQKIEYISLSGVVSLSQLIFRLLEFCFEPFESNSCYLIQFFSSIIGFILTISYIIIFIKKEIKIWWIL